MKLYNYSTYFHTKRTVRLAEYDHRTVS